MFVYTSKQHRDFVSLHVFYASDIYVRHFFVPFKKTFFGNFYNNKIQM